MFKLLLLFEKKKALTAWQLEAINFRQKFAKEIDTDEKKLLKDLNKLKEKEKKTDKEIKAVTKLQRRYEKVLEIKSQDTKITQTIQELKNVINIIKKNLWRLF
jgi:CRISPR/Cas system-associated exonuclease Cas4 (RecB family)